MKRCPRCNQTYLDDSLNFCLSDGGLLFADDEPEETVVARRAEGRNTKVRGWALYFSVAAASLALLAVIGVFAIFLNMRNGESPLIVNAQYPNLTANSANKAGNNSSPKSKKSPPSAANIEDTANSNIVNSDSVNKNSYSGCRLLNDTDETSVYIRSDCDRYDCDRDPSLIKGSLPDNTPARILQGTSKVRSKLRPYSFVKVEIIATGLVGWVADTKIKCG